MINLLCELNAWKFMTLSDVRENRKGTMESVHPRWWSVQSHTVWGKGNPVVTIPSPRSGNSFASFRSNISSSFSRAIFSSRFKNLSRVISKFVSRIHNQEIQLDEIGYRFANFCTSVSLRHLIYFSLPTLNIFFYFVQQVQRPNGCIPALHSEGPAFSSRLGKCHRGWSPYDFLSTSHKRWNNASDFVSVHIL